MLGRAAADKNVFFTLLAKHSLTRFLEKTRSQTMDVSHAAPRVNAAQLAGLVGKKVLLVGRVSWEERVGVGGANARRFFFRAQASRARAPPRPLTPPPRSHTHANIHPTPHTRSKTWSTTSPP